MEICMFKHIEFEGNSEMSKFGALEQAFICELNPHTLDKLQASSCCKT